MSLKIKKRQPLGTVNIEVQKIPRRISGSSKQLLRLDDLVAIVCKKCGNREVDLSVEECGECGNTISSYCNKCGARFDYHAFKHRGKG